jgi:hypothetical protein
MHDRIRVHGLAVGAEQAAIDMDSIPVPLAAGRFARGLPYALMLGRKDEWRTTFSGAVLAASATLPWYRGASGPDLVEPVQALATSMHCSPDVRRVARARTISFRLRVRFPLLVVLLV